MSFSRVHALLLWFPCFILAVSTAATAGETETMRFSDAFLARGESKGIRVAPEGVLSRGPDFEVFRAAKDDIQQIALWDAAFGSDGVLYAVGGTPGGLFRQGSNGRLTPHARIDDPLATAAVELPDGSWIVAGAPTGRLWKIAKDGTREHWADTDARYVWKLALDANGSVWAATGDPARLLALDADGEARRVFEPDESHLTVLQAAPSGGWWVGGAGRGRLYHVDTDGRAEVIYDDDLDEVVSLTTFGDERIVALTRHKPGGDRAPRIRIRLPREPIDTTSLPGLGDEVSRSLEGTLEADETPRVADSIPRGRVIRLGREGATEEIWSSATQAPFALSSSDTQIWMGIGEPATLLEYGDDGWTRTASWPENTITSMTVERGTLALTTAHAATVLRSLPSRESGGSLLSPAADAGAVAQWGRLRWRSEGNVYGVEFSTRTGNSPHPDTTWSSWSPPLTDPTGSPILSDGARYMQWRLRWKSPGVGSGSLYRLEASYTPLNRAPEIESFSTDTPRPEKETVEVRWEVLDPDRDALRVELQSRQMPDGDWNADAVTISEPGAPGEAKNRRNGRFKWSIIDRPEGDWDLRLYVDDQPGNPPGSGRHRTGRIRRLIVDRTPPDIHWEPSGDGWQARVEDLHSPIVRFQGFKGGELQFSLQPLDGVADGLKETFRLRGEIPVDVDWTFRAVDASGNVEEVAGPTS